MSQSLLLPQEIPYVSEGEITATNATFSAVEIN